MDFVGNSEIQGTLLPFRVPPHIFIIFLSSFSLSLSIFFLVLVHLSWIEKKNHAASFHAPHGTLSFLFFLFFFFLTFTTPRLLIFHPSIRTPLYDGPCPASGNVRFFLSLSFSALPPMEICTNFRRDGGWTVEKKKSSLKICLTVEGSSQWECDVDVPMVFRREKRWVEW